eukprot:snap_masked-scaffold_11-processed-gene-6.35-mRNA-1 protein AED:1.00 eAED:1.00 QI:0/0/0/0/1/1/2/0/102
MEGNSYNTTKEIFKENSLEVKSKSGQEALRTISDYSGLCVGKIAMKKVHVTYIIYNSIVALFANTYLSILLTIMLYKITRLIQDLKRWLKVLIIKYTMVKGV